jgi:hypothetical protein
MPREKASAEPSFGFMSTVESPEYGHFGGYLIVSPLGRPIEFHCTSPVKPSRAQEILYGPTLQPFLIGEQICGALLNAAKSTPRLILTDAAAMLLARTHAASPVALLVVPATKLNVANTDDSGESPEADASTPKLSQLKHFAGQVEIAGYELLLPSGFEEERHAVAELAGQLSHHVDLAEPFGRIHEAIREAQRIGSRAGDVHGQAA